MPKNSTAPIMENEYVQELLKILRDNQAPSMNDFLAVLNQVGAMERQLEAAVLELQGMRRELAEAQAQNHPVKNTLQKAVISMQAQVLELRDKLAELKENIINSCKNAIAVFREKGISALDHIARFFRIKPMLENMRDSLDKNIKFDDRAIAKIEAVSTEYHQAGLHVKNMSRAMTGKDAAQEAKPPGKIAAAISYPFRAERRCFASMKNSAEAAIASMARLEERAKERKPSIKKTLEDINVKIEQAKKDAPELTRPKQAVNER